MSFLLNPKKGFERNDTTIHVLTILYIETFPITFNLAYKKGEKHMHSGLYPVVD